MKILYENIIDRLLIKPTKEDLSDKLFQLGHEHEIQGDIFHMEFTPNRGDCLSLVGLSRDLKPFFGLAEPIDLYNGDIENLKINFKNLSPKDCPKISFLEIEIHDEIKEYKPYLESYFSILDTKKINFFTDISNYLSYEYGQPTHCYDNSLINDQIVFQNKEINKNFETLIGTEITLNGKNCYFSVNDEVINLAGVMGGKSTACSSNTKNVLVECAFFNPEKIIGKSIKYNLTSDAAHKFERGVDIKSQEDVLRRFTKIVEDHAKIKKVKMVTYEYSNFTYKNLPFNTKKINEILGTNIDSENYKQYLESLGFEVTDQIKIPSYRNDVTNQNDLAEEIARVIGFNNISSTSIDLKNIKRITKDQNINKVKNFLINNGFSEVINYPFNSKKESDSIVIDNPLDSNKAYFRTNLKSSLIENLLFNERRQKDSIKLFEISDIYLKKQKINKYSKLGIIISGRQGNNYIDFSKKLDLKYLNNLMQTNTNENFFSINEIPRYELDTKKKDKIYYIEVKLDDIPNEFFSNLKARDEEITFINYEPISEFPSSTRDFSFSINDPLRVDNVIKYFEKVSDEILKDLFLFDFYKDNKSSTVKLGYRFVFQSINKTLSDEEINLKVNEILSPILEIDGISIPGMLKE